MGGTGDDASALGRRLRAVGRWLRTPTGVTLALVALAAALRFPLLGARVAHWDEARVAWWILRYRETGFWRYFPILHGPFLFHVERWLFTVFEPSDAVMRLPVAVVGSLFPATALWYRDHLEDGEVVALAFLLAVAPLLVFYSRFMRNDLLLAAFSFAALGAVLRGAATGKRRYGLAAAILFGLAVTTKENAVLYLLCWVGAASLVAAWDVRRADDHGAALASVIATVRSGVRRWLPTATAGMVGFLAVVVAFYAPRTPEPGAGFDDLATHPELLGPLTREATLGSARRLVDLWITGGLQDHSYPVFLGKLAGLVLLTSPSVLALAVYGGYREWRGRDGGRWLVRFAFVWTGLSLLGYPAAVDIIAGWTPIPVVVAMTVPAAVGLSSLRERVRPTLSRWTAGTVTRTPSADRGRTLALVGVLLVGIHLGAVGPAVTFAAPDHRWNPYPQPAQPPGAMRPTVDAVAAVSADDPGLDVAYVGSDLADGFLSRLPLPWYVRREGGTARWYANASALPPSPPPVVVASAAHHDELAAELEGYRCVSVILTAWSGRGPKGDGPYTHVYVDRDAVPSVDGSTRSSQRCG